MLAAQFEDQEDSVESVTKKQELLERTLYTQQDKVDTLRAALQNAAVSFGEADARTMRWQEQLNHAEAELIATNRAIRNTADALEDLTSISNRYKGKLDEIEESLTYAESVLRRVKAENEAFGKTTESISAKQDALNNILTLQTQKVETLKEALAEATERYGETDDRTQSLQVQLNKAAEAFARTRQEINATAEEINELESVSNRYRKSLTDIEKSLEVANSELELTSAEYAGQEKSIESISAEQDALNYILALQTQKVETLKEALAEATVKYGEADNRTKDFQTQLNRAEAELARTNNQLKKTSEALNDVEENLGETDTDFETLTENLGETDTDFETLTENLDVTKSGTVGLGDALDQIGSKFGISLPNEMTSTLNGMAQVNTKTLALTGGLAALATAIVGVEKKLIDLTRESAAYVDDLNTLSDTSGISVEKLQEYAYAAELLNVSVDKLSQSHIEVTKSMNDAMNGSAERIEAFNRLGVTYSYTNGVLRDSEEVFWEVIDALGEVENTTERDALAMKILSESATELNPLIEAGSEKMREFAEEAQNAGYVLDEEAISSLQAADDAMQRFEKTTEAAKNQIAAEFAPALTEATEDSTKFVSKLGDAFKESGVVESFGDMLTSASGLLEPAGELIEWALPGLTTAFDTLAYSTAIVADTLSAIAGLLQGLTGGDGIPLRRLWDGIPVRACCQPRESLYYKDALEGTRYDETLGAWTGNADLSGINAGTVDVNTPTTTLVWENGKWVSANASGNINWRGGVTWVGENGPEKVYLPQGSQILNAQESRNEGNTVIYVTIDAKNVREFNDIVKIAQEARMKSRKEKG